MCDSIFNVFNFEQSIFVHTIIELRLSRENQEHKREGQKSSISIMQINKSLKFSINSGIFEFEKPLLVILINLSILSLMLSNSTVTICWDMITHLKLDNLVGNIKKVY